MIWLSRFSAELGAGPAMGVGVDNREVSLDRSRFSMVLSASPSPSALRRGAFLLSAALVLAASPARADDEEDAAEEPAVDEPPVASIDDAEIDDEEETEVVIRSRFPKPPPGPSGKGRPTRVPEDRARFRGGVSAQIGGYIIEDTGLGLFGIQGRLGAQIIDEFGIYATPGFQLGASTEGALARVSIGVIPELTLGDLWFIGAGPEVFAAAGIDDELDVFGGAYLIAARLRTGFAFGSKRPGRRHAFTLAFDGHVDFYDGKVGVAPTVALGYDAF